MDSLDQNLNLNKKELVVTQDARYNFGIAGKWAKFLAIVGFISFGLFVLGGISQIILSANTNYAYLRGQFIGTGIGYLVLGGVMIFPALYLLRYANRIKKGLESDDQLEFDAAVQNLKSLFKFTGIYTIVIIGIYVLVIIFAIIAAAANGGRF